MRRIAALVCCLFCLSLLIMPVRAEEEPKYVVLTFDDGPSGRFTRNLLEGLKKRNAKATFLLCGYRMEQYPELVVQILEAGHEVGLHGFSHNCMGNMCQKTLQQELSRCRALLPGDYTPTFLRPPGGVLNATVRQAAAEAGLAILTWSVDPKDWATEKAGVVESAVLNKVRDGDVVLLHDMSDSSVEAALAIVEALQQEGFQFVTASELAALRGVTPEPGKTFFRFPPK